MHRGWVAGFVGAAVGVAMLSTVAIVAARPDRGEAVLVVHESGGPGFAMPGYPGIGSGPRFGWVAPGVPGGGFGPNGPSWMPGQGYGPGDAERVCEALPEEVQAQCQDHVDEGGS